MWLEAILAKSDFVALLPELTPLTINLSGGGTVELDEPSGVELVADVGLRVTCKAKLHWPVLGIQVPVTLHSLTAVAKPQIAETSTGDRLVFTFNVEKADFAGLPDVVDEKITEKINEALVRDHVALEWDFTDTLSHVFPMPATLDHLEALGLQVAWGEVRVTPDAVVFAVSFHARVMRTGERERDVKAGRLAGDAPIPPLAAH